MSSVFLREQGNRGKLAQREMEDKHSPERIRERRGTAKETEGVRNE